MNNKIVSKTLQLLGQLMELHDQNAFKAKAYSNAAYRIKKLDLDLSSFSQKDLENIEGIGKTVASKICELHDNGTIKELEELVAITPPGIVEMLQIKGLGPKKIALIWKDMGIENTGELLYACNENRLAELKGFGYKTQEEIKKAIEFALTSTGKYHYAAIEEQALNLLQELKKSALATRISFTGDFRRKCEVIDKLDFLVATDDHAGLRNDFMQSGYFTEVVSETPEEWLAKTENGLLVQVYNCPEAHFPWNLFVTTGNTLHVQSFLHYNLLEAPSEEAVYEAAGLPFIEPEMREGLDELEQAQKGTMPALLVMSDLKGILHNHSTYSDGIHSLKEMALYCKELGYEYLGICDHSRSAFYANGLKEDRIILQHREIDELNKELSPFHIYKGIESDILYDGSLDYSDEVLDTFDFIVASIHTNFKMDKEKATQRLIKAVENPYTTILGHPTGRLLLYREGYPIDHKKVIDACAANGVIIEINSNPFRLDIDWRWVSYALSKNVRLSINPDAHKKEAYHDMYYGVCVGRKGGLTKEMTLNALSNAEIGDWFKARKAKMVKG